MKTRHEDEEARENEKKGIRGKNRRKEEKGRRKRKATTPPRIPNL